MNILPIGNARLVGAEFVDAEYVDDLHAGRNNIQDNNIWVLNRVYQFKT